MIYEETSEGESGRERWMEGERERGRNGGREGGRLPRREVDVDKMDIDKGKEI